MPYDQFKNVFVSEGGNLIRKNDCRLVRPQYSYTFRDIKNTHQLRATLRNGAYTDVGGYPLYLICADGAEFCFDCAKRDYKRIVMDMNHEEDGLFKIIGCDINWENDDMQCAHCNKIIPSAYGSDDDSET